MTKTCVCCEKTTFTKLIHYPRAPKNIQGLLRKEDLAKDRHITFDLIKCDTCGLIQLSDFENIPGDYYDEYVMAQTHSAHSRNYSKWLAKEFVNEFKLQGKELLEIGCGDGEFLKYLKEEGVKTLGVEPSAPFVKIAREKGLEVREEYFDDTTPLKHNSYDAIASRAVFEHLKNLNEVLRNAWNVLREGGVGMIEVPSFEKAIKDRRYYDVFSDHVVYYTKHSLMGLLEHNGFEILKAFNVFEDEYIVVYFKKNSMYNLKNFVAELATYKTTFEQGLRQMRTDGKRVALWGAGAKGNAVLNLCDVRKEDVAYVIDSDPHKIGKYTIGNHFPIVAPDTVKTDTPEVIIITAMAFYDEILTTIRDTYEFTGEVWAIAPKLHKIS